MQEDLHLYRAVANVCLKASIWVDAVSAMDVDAPDMNFEDLEDDSDGGDSNNDSQLAPRAQVSDCFYIGTALERRWRKYQIVISGHMRHWRDVAESAGGRDGNFKQFT